MAGKMSTRIWTLPSSYKSIWRTCQLTFILSLLVCANGYPQFEDTNDPTNTDIYLQNMLINGTDLYVGSVNRLYKLRSSDLTEVVSFKTGPGLDHLSCRAPRYSCDYERTETDNVNKLLLMYDGQLITCSNFYQGRCEFRDVNTLNTTRGYNKEVVSNFIQGRAVGFITGQDLYTATPLGGWSRGIDVPTIARRLLEGDPMFGDDPFDPMSQTKIPRNTITEADNMASYQFNISYVHAFTSGTHSYFVALQVEDYQENGSPIRTKISRVCNEDASNSFYSYMELPLKCSHDHVDGTTNYNLAQSAFIATVGTHMDDVKPGEEVLFITFSESESGTSLEPTAKSAVCMYSVRAIDAMMAERRIECANSEDDVDTTEIEWLGNTPCFADNNVVQGIQADPSGYCFTEAFNQPLGTLSFVLEAKPLYTTDDTILTAIAATPHLEQTVIFLGDEDGNLRKLRVTANDTADLYEEMVIDSNSAVAQNGLAFDADKDFIYVMTQRKITKVPVEECEKYTNCEDCTQVGNGVGDAYCGWCSLQKSCTRRYESECAGSDDLNSRRWLGPATLCSQVESVVPTNTPRGAATEIELMITNLPKLDDGNIHRYVCVFVDKTEGEFATTPASVEFMTDRTNITCATPPANLIPQPAEGSLTVELYIRASETNQKIAMTTFDFYECGAFSGCLQCVDNDYSCDWCIYENTCTGNAASCNSNGVIGSRNSTNAQRSKKGPGFCPFIKDTSKETLIPVDVLTHIDIPAANLPVPLSGDGDFECVILLDGEVAKVKATRENETLVRCDGWNYMYGSDVPTMEVALNVQWNGSYILDNPNQLTVTLYKCSAERGNCGSCLMADSKFNCGWCIDRTRCVHQSKCGSAPDQFLAGDNVCPDPHITGFEPNAGHIRGGTEVRIEGVNLGQVASDIKEIYVAQQPCKHLNESYVPSRVVVCRTSAISLPMKGMIQISIGTGEDAYIGLSQDSFSYVQPVIDSFYPTIGPKSGGTEVSIEGTYLNVGSKIQVEVAGQNCTIRDSSMSSRITCRTDRGPPEVEGPIKMIFDDNGTEISNDYFIYKDDPTIDSLDEFRTIISGGLTVEVRGTNLNVIQSPEMVFHIANKMFKTNCTDIGATSMKCKTPNLKPSNKSTPFTISKSMIGFVLDGVLEFRNLAQVENVRDKFEVVQDPVYRMLTDDDRIYNKMHAGNKFLEIQGDNLTLASESEDPDIRVFIGADSECEPINLKSGTLTCTLPDTQPASLPGDSLPRIIVTHGNLRFDIGFVRYLPPDLPLLVYIGPAVGAFLFFLIIILVIAIYRHIGERDRRIKRLEKQRDEMEMRVAQECKDAFTELQISVLTVSGDVEGSGIPFRSYRGYTSMVLFPDNPDHPALKEIPVAKEKISGIKKEVLQHGLMEFGNLIGNKSFLRVFTQTLERQKMLTTKDKTNIASLLMVALHGKMEYLTEIMKSLMQDMIARYVREGCPHVLMRRSDTVVEKLVSHWVAFLLYDFVRETAGQPLFHLYYAIKQQVAKGPVDAITGEARYGLSELKVIRQQTDHKAMTISAIGLDREAGPVVVKVLDCDTISQVKEKILDAIYKTMPYSQRPQKEELDLEWKDGSLSTILLDDDGSREIEGEWKRLNTLSHYRVSDGATLVLVRSQGMSSTPHGSLQRGSPIKRVGQLYTPHSPASSVTPILDMENGIGIMHNWHLVKKQGHDSLRKGDKYHTLMAEIYLPRLLTTKGILQQFVDELFETLFTLDSDSSSIPIAIKYLFDFLDEEANKHCLEDSNITHFWKSNILQLRFWVNMVNNPDMLFDINRSDTVLACMSVIGQTLMDSCSVTQHQLTPDSPSSKLLYAKDIQHYKEMVAGYYRDIQDYPVISDQDMNAALASHSQRHNSESNYQAINALNELYFCYACIYRSQLMQALDEEESTRKQQLGDKFDKIFKLMADSV